MATGDVNDMVGRMKAVLPSRWFPLPNPDGSTASPILDGILTGMAWPWAQIYLFGQFTQLQTRIATASGAFLDIISSDFLGKRLFRAPGQGDTSFRARILAEILRPRATRSSVIQALFDLTGRTPVIFEPRWPPDTGGYGFQGMTVGTNLAYGLAGGWGSMALPFQFFVTAYRAIGGGIAKVAGYGSLCATEMDLTTTGESTIVVSTDVPPLIPNAHVLKCTMTSSGSHVAGQISEIGVADQNYGIAIWVWIPNGSSVSSVAFQAETGNAAAISGTAPNTSSTSAWQAATQIYTASGGATSLVLRVAAASPGAIIYATCARFDLASPVIGQAGGYGVGAIEWGSLDMSAGHITDADIDAAIVNVLPVGTTAWTRISP